MFMLIAAGRGNAGALLWNVSFTLDDGGHGTGTFVFDADLVNTCSNCPMLNWNITVSGGNVGLFPAFTYTPADSFASGFSAGPSDPGGSNYLFSTGTGSGGDRQLRLMFLPALTNAGGTSQLYTGIPGFDGECFNCSPLRSVVSGSASTAPEPVGAAACGIAVLGFMARRRRRKSS
jgi:hypothetical protein